MFLIPHPDRTKWRDPIPRTADLSCTVQCCAACLLRLCETRSLVHLKPIMPSHPAGSPSFVLLLLYLCGYLRPYFFSIRRITDDCQTYNLQCLRWIFLHQQYGLNEPQKLGTHSAMHILATQSTLQCTTSSYLLLEAKPTRDHSLHTLRALISQMPQV
jgi:hypothetical protein